jgi:hypothetical protein
MLLIVPLYGYCQNTTLLPKISKDGFCYDSLQIREVARISKVTKSQRVIINHQDSLITDLKTVVSNCDSINIKKDSIIVNQLVIIENKNQNIAKTKKYYQNELTYQKEKTKKKIKKLGFIAVLEAVLLVIVLVVK